MVAEGRLGRKAGRGFYDYDDGERPDASDAAELADAGRREVLERLVAQLVNEACFAAEEGVAAPAEIDAAMRLGLNHPRGPFEWARELGPTSALAILDALGGLGGRALGRASACCAALGRRPRGCAARRRRGAPVPSAASQEPAQDPQREPEPDQRQPTRRP